MLSSPLAARRCFSRACLLCLMRRELDQPRVRWHSRAAWRRIQGLSFQPARRLATVYWTTTQCVVRDEIIEARRQGYPASHSRICQCALLALVPPRSLTARCLSTSLHTSVHTSPSQRLLQKWSHAHGLRDCRFDFNKDLCAWSAARREMCIEFSSRCIRMPWWRTLGRSRGSVSRQCTRLTNSGRHPS